MLATMPLPESLHVVTVRGDLSGGAQVAVELVYLADADLGADAREMLIKLVASRIRVSVTQVTLRWVPAVWTVPLSPGGAIDAGADDALRVLSRTLAEFTGLGAALELPRRLSAARADAARQQIQRRIGVADLPVDEAPPESDGRDAVVRVRTRPGPP
jgi:hypothetical protein